MASLTVFAKAHHPILYSQETLESIVLTEFEVFAEFEILK